MTKHVSKTSTPPAKPASDPDRTPLVVDLDGTLSRTDTLHEAVLGLLARRPMMAFRLPGWLKGGRAAFKAQVAEAHLVAGADLPLNETVVDLVRQARADGRPTALVSAADQRQAEAAAGELGLFDDIIGTRDGLNLKGDNKADFLVERFGAGGFDYVGDSSADVAVWAKARRALTVGADPALRRAAETANAQTDHLSPPDARPRHMLRAMRPHQWSKNALLFLPALAAHDFGTLGAVLAAFVAFCLTASAVYVINDLLDLSADRAHPTKCRRPFAAGHLSAADGVVLAAGLLGVALVISLLGTSALFLGVLFVYLASTFAYSLWLKRKLLVDVLTLAGLYTIRIIAGGVAAAVILSPWLLGFSMFLFLALAAVKRQAELTEQMTSGRTSARRAYKVEDLPILRGIALSGGMAAVMVLALYIASDAVQLLYGMPELLWLVCPIVLYWILRMVMMTHRGYMTDDPIVFAASDRVSLITIFAAFSVVLAAALL